MPNEDRRRGTGEACDGMMFRKPKTAVSPLFYVLRKIDCACDRATRGLIRTHSYKIEN